MKITKAEDDFLQFDNGETISTVHYQECSEDNWAAFSELDDLAMSYNFKSPLQFRKESYGFSFGDDKRMFFVPCYSAQNGYYTDEIDVYYNDKFIFEADGEYCLDRD